MPCKIQLSLAIHRELIPGPPWILKVEDAQVPYVKWCNICMYPTHILLYTLNHLEISYNT